MSKAVPESALHWMSKGVWGPIKWKELHARALAYLPMNDEEEWFKSFVTSIPCPHCQKHFELFLDNNPPRFTTRPDFFVWTVRAHNYVNRSNKKPELTLEQALVLHTDCMLPEN